MDCTNFKVGIGKNNEFPIFCDTGIPVLAINKLFLVGFAILAHYFNSLILEVAIFLHFGQNTLNRIPNNDSPRTSTSPQ
jgi:hypothetical protein